MKNERKNTVMKHLSYLASLSLVGWSMSVAIADDTVTPPPTTVTPPAVAPADTDTDTKGSKPAMDAERAKELATTYGVTEQQVLTMRQTDHMGWGEIKNLLLISQRVAADSASSKTPLTKEEALAQVLKQRQSGMGIGQIAKKYNVKLGDLQSGNKAAKAEGVDKTDRPEKVAKPEKPEKPAKVEKPEKPEKPAKVEKPEKPEKPAKVEKPEKVDKPGKGN